MHARPFNHLRSIDGWARARHTHTAIDLPDGGVMLAWRGDGPADHAPAPPLGAGLGFDSRCRLYRTLPEEGRVERYGWR
ncbi:MAG: hypothetical protein QOG42_1136, partial [Solirubrobacteraceae bacterium]|nr:hypothetical protein [Solirubrobacteraceae bacterium]